MSLRQRAGWLAGLALVCAWGWARADAVLLIEDPVKSMEGKFTSAGHSAVWLDRLCSDDHVTMRRCRADEAGTVLSRYPGMETGQDWLAMPVGAYLYAVDSAEAVPSRVTKAEFTALTDAYRATHGRSFARDPEDKIWTQLVGESYRRRILLLRVHTTEAEDERLMGWLNQRPNEANFNLLSSNCSDFAGLLLGELFPGGFHRSFLFDAGMMTPRENLADLHRYAVKHGLQWEASVVPQVPGEFKRSGHARGVTEAYLKSWWFLLPLDVLDPLELGAVTGLGLADHRYSGGKAAVVKDEKFFGAQMRASAE